MNEAYRETQKKSEANAASSSGVACMPGYHCDKVKRQSRSILERGLGVRGQARPKGQLPRHCWPISISITSSISGQTGGESAMPEVIIVRYAEDIVIGFEHEGEARRFVADMRQRMEKFALSLHPEKTQRLFQQFAGVCPGVRCSGWEPV